MIVSELELKILLEEFRNASNEEGLLEKENFFRVVKTTLSQKFDIQNSMPAFHRIYEAFDLDGNGAIDFVELATGLSTLLYGEEKDILRCKLKSIIGFERLLIIDFNVTLHQQLFLV